MSIPNKLQSCIQACADWGIIPTEFKQSMTWEEQVLWLFKYLNNTVIPTVNENIEEIQNIRTEFAALAEHVDDYFDDLDVQEEINNKLDTMASDGTLGAILVQYMQPSIDAQNARITGIETDFAALDARMDTFTSLTEGSTTGDAELADIRTGFNGFTFASAGAAVRGEDSYIDNKVQILNTQNGLINVLWENGSINPSTGTDITHEKFIRTNGFIARNKYVYVKVETGYRGVIFWYDADDTLLSSANFSASFTAANSDAAKFRLVLRSTDDSATANLSYAKNINLYDMNQYIEQGVCNNNLFIDFDNANSQIKIKSYTYSYIFSRGKFDTATNLNVTIDYPVTTGATYSLVYDFSTGSFMVLPLATSPNTHQKLVLTFLLYSNGHVLGKNVYPNGDVKVFINGKSKEHLFNNVSILGDSYSTFEDWILPDDRDYYPTASAETNNVQSVSQTYWYKLAHSLNANVLVNDSFAGSTIALTERSGHTYEDSFVKRMENSFGTGRLGEVKPDLIIICGGTNDYWNSVTIGSAKYSGWTEDDLKQFAPAFCYMLDYVKTFNPNATIVNITNDILGSDYKTAMADACTHYGVTNVTLSDISKMSNHPDITGMSSIHAQTLTAILNNL